MLQAICPKSPQKAIIFSIYDKLSIANILKRWHLVGEKSSTNHQMILYPHHWPFMP